MLDATDDEPPVGLHDPAPQEPEVPDGEVRAPLRNASPLILDPGQVRAANAGRRFWNKFIILPYRQVILTEHPAIARFFGAPCTHLAGMIAYFALLSVIPAAFVVLATLSWSGALASPQYLIDQLNLVMPHDGVTVIVHTVERMQANSRSLGVIGIVGVILATTNFFSSIESALNIIYGVNNRLFVYQKLWVMFLMLMALVAMTASVFAASIAIPLINNSDHLPSWAHISSIDAFLSLAISFVVSFAFLFSVYRFLPNTQMHSRDCWRGALGAAILFQLTIHALPLYLANSGDGVVLKAFAGALIVLIWFYLMALILLAGGVFNWWWERRHLLRSATSPGRNIVSAAAPSLGELVDASLPLSPSATARSAGESFGRSRPGRQLGGDT